ncbi:MAG: hypothetical protein ACFCUE_03880 [Candidatus Bathyarchaeia archaeon]|jgi:hypothetical protein
MIDRIKKVEIFETQQESEKDDEMLFTLFVNGKTVSSWAKTILYSNLEDIHTVDNEKRKGYGKLLLTFIEKRAQNHYAPSMRTNDFKSHDVEATDSFKLIFQWINHSIFLINGSVNSSIIFREQ